MGIRNPSWYVLNENRDYPLDDTATCQPGQGDRLPHNIIADLRLRWPAYLGRYAFVSAVTVTPGLVSVVLQATSTLDNVTGDHMPLAVVSVPLPVDLRRQYPLQAQMPGVYGYIVFGNGVQDPYAGRFASPAQGLLAPRAARPYAALPVSSTAKLYAESGLTGLVLLQGEAPVEVVAEYREIQGATRRAAVIRLADDYTNDDSRVADSVFSQFAGPCAGRPESQTCGDPQPIEYINAVGPDCNGVIEIIFNGCAVVGGNADNASIVVDCGFGLTESCLPPYLPDHEGRLPEDYPPLVLPPLPTPQPQPSSVSIHDHIIVLGELPYLTCFAGDNSHFTVVEGQFLVTGGTDAFAPCGSGQVFSTNSVSGNLTSNVVVWEGFDVATLFRRVTTDVMLLDGPPGYHRNAGLVINRRESSVDPTSYVYYAAFLDYDAQTFSIVRNNGTSFQTAVSVNVPGLALKKWYRISATVAPYQARSIAITVHLRGLDDPSVDVTLSPLLVTNYMPDSGYYGFVADRALSHFAFFQVEEWSP
jgi:hypothetical protein